VRKEGRKTLKERRKRKVEKLKMDSSLPDCNVCKNADCNGANHFNHRTNNHAVLETMTTKMSIEAKCVFFAAAVVIGAVYIIL
jgi:hypothetical protein